MLIAVDGTDSEQNRRYTDLYCTNFSVQNFCKDYQGPGRAFYHEGPGLLGQGVSDTIDWALRVIRENISVNYSIRYNLPDQGAELTRPVALTGVATRPDAAALVDRVQSELDQAWMPYGSLSHRLPAVRMKYAEPINLLGFSRGALIVMQVANRLNDCTQDSSRLPFGWTGESGAVEVNFLGLYDAVSDYAFAYTEEIPANVQTVYHVYRELLTGSMASRPYFLPTGRLAASPTTRYFRYPIAGTHSAIGGDPAGGDRLGRYEYGCAVTRSYQTAETLLEIQTGLPRGVLNSGRVPGPEEACRTIERQTLEQARQTTIDADRWMRQGAQSCGLQLAAESCY